MSEISKNQIVLLGSGASKSAGMPTTDEITNTVLTLDGVVASTNDAYYIVPKRSDHFDFMSCENLPRVRGVLDFVNEHINEYYNDWLNNPANYEDFYLAVSQIYDAIMFEYRNPALQPIINLASVSLSELQKGKEGETRNRWRLDELFDETTKCIADIVSQSLNKRPVNTEYLSFIADASRDVSVNQFDICTLNHDVVLETFLNINELRFNDGFVPFSDISQEFQWWNTEEIFKRDSRIRLLKLHGSIDWYRYRRLDNKLPRDFTAKYISWDKRELFEKLKVEAMPLQNHPRILVGTYNKILDYQGEVFHDLQHCFYDSLRHSDKLFVSGYSFNDRAVNTRIIIWMFSSANKQLVIAHDDFSELKNNSSPAISRSFDDWLLQNRLNIIPKMIEGVAWEEIKSAFDQSG